MSETAKSACASHLLDLKGLFSGRETKVAFDRSFPLEYALCDVHGAGECRVCGTLSDYSGVLQFDAEFTFPYVAECARCLRQVRQELRFRVDRPVSEREQEEGETVLQKEDVIDLSELMLEGIDEHLPGKHLCSDACKGLCPFCGTDLNEATCSCKRPPDPRLAGLSEFFHE